MAKARTWRTAGPSALAGVVQRALVPWFQTGFRVFWGSGFRVEGVRAPCQGFIFGGSWYLLTTYNWAYNPTYDWDDPYKAFSGYYK